jgi:hypothetical protein
MRGEAASWINHQDTKDTKATVLARSLGVFVVQNRLGFAATQKFPAAAKGIGA